MRDTNFRPEGGPTSKVDCPLIGEDGNAYFIINRLDKALRKAGATPEYRDAVRLDMTAGDYDHLLQVAMREIDGKIATDEADEADEDEASGGFVEYKCPDCGKPNGRVDTAEQVSVMDGFGEQCEDCASAPDDTFAFIMGLRG